MGKMTNDERQAYYEKAKAASKSPKKVARGAKDKTSTSFATSSRHIVHKRKADQITSGNFGEKLSSPKE